MKNLFDALQNSNTEEEVKFSFAKFFNLKLDTKNYIDLYTPQILFEFKFDANLKNPQNRAKIFAQALYYAHRLKYGTNNESRALTKFICAVTKSAAIVLPTGDFKNFYTDPPNKKIYDWRRSPSSPDQNLIAKLAKDKILQDCRVFDFKVPKDAQDFSARLREHLQAQTSLFDDKKIINESNFEDAFNYWQSQFLKYLDDVRKPSEYFITDIEAGKSIVDGKHHVLFHMNDGSTVRKLFHVARYETFWNTYEKIQDPAEIIAIRQKMDRMTEINQRRFTGEFYTPTNFAELAVEYLEDTLGKNWWKRGNFRLWDMAAGTGNLEFCLPADALQFCYISTLNPDDAAYCKKIFPAATVFQYDYLNDDVEFLANPTLFNLGAKYKMPQNLRDDLQNPKIKWIIFINPPYAAPTPFHRKEISGNQEGVSNSAIQKLMKQEHLGESSREVYVQFLYRISKEFKDRKVWVGIFSSLKYVKSEQGFMFRKKIFPADFERGFIFSAKNFQGCKGNFPVGFLIWNLAESISLETQKISVDVFNDNLEKTGIKNIKVEHSDEFLNKWITRPAVKKIFPPISSGVTIAYQNKNPRNRIAENFLASFLCSSNDFANQNYTAFFSGPAVSHGGYSITPENFEKSLITHAVRRLKKADWLNNRDQFMQPTKKLPAEFICDAVIWSLFAASNQTVSLRDVQYEGAIYRMPNNLYPFLLSEIGSWKLPAEFALQIISAQDRFAAKWLSEHDAEISATARAVLAAGKILYRQFYEKFDALNVADLKIEDWDAGWYQVRMAIKNFGEITALKAAHAKLGEKLLPQIYELGFLRDEVIEFD